MRPGVPFATGLLLCLCFVFAATKPSPRAPTGSPPLVAARLAFRCSPKGKFLGLSVNGRMVSFAENVFYEFRLSKIASVWSVIDKAAIEAQLPGVTRPPTSSLTAPGSPRR
jgi:SnoaL-like polyketide cyclase